MSLNYLVRIFIPAILVLVSAIGCDRAKKEEPLQSSASEQKWQSAMSTLAKQYHAITNWEQQIPDRTVKGPFTIDVSNALVQTNDQPVLLVMDLCDVSENAGGHTVQFVEEYVTSSFFKLVVEVKCTEEQTKQLLRIRDDLFPRCAVVARISQVSRFAFAVSGTRDEENVNVELDASPAVFLAKGTCVDLLIDEPQKESMH